MNKFRQLSLKTLLGIVLLASIAFAVFFSRWSHSIPVSSVSYYALGDVVDVFMMPPKGTYLDGGWEMDRLCCDVKVIQIDKSENIVVVSVSAADKWNLQTCDRELMLADNPLDENPIWID